MDTNLLTNPGAGDMEQQLWNYLDDKLTASEKKVIESLIESQAAWNSKYRELTEIHQLLQSAELESPSLRFSKNVMEEIARLQIAPATRNYINKKIIWGLGIFFITLFAGFLIYGFGQITFTGNETASPLSRNMSKVDISRFFNNTWVNVFMMINVVLGLFLLDVYLGSKRKRFRNEA